MPDYASSPAPKSVLWFLVSDGKEARVYRRRLIEHIIPIGGTGKHVFNRQTVEPELEAVPDMAFEAEPLEAYKADHDQLGSVSGSATSARRTVEHPDLRKEIKFRFMQSVAAALKQAEKDGRFDRLIVAAPPRMLGALRASLEPSIANRIEAEIHKDLTKCSAGELQAHLTAAL